MEDAIMIALDDPRWSSFVEGRPEATAFHRPGWSRTLADAYGFEPFVLALLENGDVTAGAPMVALGRGHSQRWVSLPFTDVCPPLGDAGAVRGLLDTADRLRVSKGLRLVEVRAEVDASVGSPGEVGVIHLLDLDADPLRVRAKLHPSQARRNVDRAKREGVEVRFETGREALVETFYRLHVLTRRRQGVPVQPKRFFSSLWQHVIDTGGGFVVVADVAGRPAGAAVFLDGKETLTYKFGASDPALLQARPNHAIFWAAIEWACRAGRRTLDFGRTDTENAGLRAFKSSWGAREESLVYTSLGQPAPRARDRARFLRPLITHSPTVVCRVLGEALYRRAA